MWAATEALALGHGGISAVARATHLTRQTIHTAVAELDQAPHLVDEPPARRIRRPGAGRKDSTVGNLLWLPNSEVLVDANTLG